MAHSPRLLSRIRRIVLRGVLLPLAALIIVACVTLAVLVWQTRAGGDLDVSVAGLSAPVNVTIDQDGIPRVAAKTEADDAMALGFLHARERLFQMDLMRRVARGEIAEFVGAAALPLDRLNRTLNLRDHAQDDLAALPPDTRALLDAYATGVNAWIDRRGRLASFEFALLGAPRHWTAADCLLWGKTMGLYLSGNWRTELARLHLSNHMNPEQIEALWPGQPAQATQASRTPWLVGPAWHWALLPSFPDPFTLPPSASNGWAVDGAHSATGKPLLAGDPHLAYGLPAIWYLARIDLPDRSLVGATAPGVPFMVLGQNGHIAWTFTTTGADVQDLFIETPDKGGVMTENGPSPYHTRTETIHVRGAPDETLVVRETRHGPVISELIGERDRIITVSMANLAAGDTAADGLLALNRAHTVQEAEAAAPRISSPVQNMTVADQEQIGFFVTGRVPIRKSGDGAMPANGADGSGEWTGWASGDALPHVVHPASGRLVNANERVAPPDFPVFLGRDWFSDARARRIRQMLDGHPQATIADFASMQTDDLDLLAAANLPRLRPLAPELAGWDGRMREDLAAPLIYNAWMIAFGNAVLDAQSVPPRDAGAAAPWPDLVHEALSPGGERLCNGDCDPMLRKTLAQSLEHLTARFGPDRAAWHWGAAHSAGFGAPLLRAVPFLNRLAEARTPASGSDATVGRGGVRQDNFESVHGAAYRGVYDLSDQERSRFVVAPGQSGNLFSSLARNFVRRWHDGDTISIPSRPASVAVRIGLSP
jgi:penicillin amidase